MAVVENKDVVQAVLGATSALAGLVLVFLGILVNTLQSYPADTPAVVTRGYRIVANVVGAAFTLGVASLALCVWWLAVSQDSLARLLALATFVAQLALLVASAVWVLSKIVWKDD
ncbi:MAG: hypothetical protein ABR540_17095 [Acidimicrobiales bacterium]